jgi:uncharacterized protein
MSSIEKPSARWSPYTVGAALGVLSWITFATMGKALGTSTTFVRVVGAAERVVAPDHVEQTSYLVKYLGTAAEPLPAIEWQFALVIALGVGAWIAARVSGTRAPKGVPALWASRFGSSPVVRAVGAFVGGALLLFGARLAGGCTSGHGISGGLQLAISSWVFIAAFMSAGIATAFSLFKVRNV